ncbi:PfkB family carbohydrate kinase [Steroidobacter cummioxidans]|uniref:PfkB family carbohydrate kinase n=1 Tax=Steroidobacter cummioxidans TaxID=1803913 RepID=UPI000E312245|nr:PfkB family carbohydrate kinase [Steroidobacter cummioxidans]
MTLHIVGGVYWEHCVHPHWNEIYGSAGRAALAIAEFGTPVVLHTYVGADALQVINDKGAWLDTFQVSPTMVPTTVGFTYLYDMAVPDIRGIPERPHAPLTLTEDKVVRFGMLEGDAVVHAKWAVYDPQNVRNGQPFGTNGSTAEHLALILNTDEASQMAGIPGAHPNQTAPVLAQQQNAELVIVKMGPEGAFIWTPTETAQVPAFRTNRVWKIGSGDCFVAHFANAWMHEGKTPVEAAEIASRATAYYCETQGFPTSDLLAQRRFSPVQLGADYPTNAPRQVYLAGPFFDLPQVWMVHQARANLLGMGLKVVSPYHDIGLGSAEDVVERDLEGIRASDLVLAITDGLDAGTIYEIGYARALNKPVIVYSERHKGESLKMMEGSGCIICDDYTTALYSTLWEAVKI